MVIASVRLIHVVQGTALGFDPVWSGIIIVFVIEISLITLPVGMTLLVLSSTLPGIPTSTIWRGVLPLAGWGPERRIFRTRADKLPLG